MSKIEHDYIDHVRGHNLITAARYGQIERLSKLVNDPLTDIHYENDTALRISAQYNQLDAFKYLYENGANIHIMDDYILCIAAYEGHTELVKLMIDNGANIQTRNGYAKKIASAKGHTDIVKMLEAC